MNSENRWFNNNITGKTFINSQNQKDMNKKSHAYLLRAPIKNMLNKDFKKYFRSVVNGFSSFLSKYLISLSIISSKVFGRSAYYGGIRPGLNLTLFNCRDFGYRLK